MERLDHLAPYQEERIDRIKSILPVLGSDFILKGGTALGVYYGLDRYSEDIDLDATRTGANIMETLSAAGVSGIRSKKHTDTVQRVMLDYGASRPDGGEYPLKIEVSFRNVRGLEDDRFKINQFDGVWVYDISELVKMKVQAFSGRDKIRDLYDIGFLLREYSEHFSKDNLQNIQTAMSYKGLEDLSMQLALEARAHSLAQFDADLYVLNIDDRVEGLLKKRNREKETDAYER